MGSMLPYIYIPYMDPIWVMVDTQFTSLWAFCKFIQSLRLYDNDWHTLTLWPDKRVVFIEFVGKFTGTHVFLVTFTLHKSGTQFSSNFGWLTPCFVKWSNPPHSCKSQWLQQQPAGYLGDFGDVNLTKPLQWNPKLSFRSTMGYPIGSMYKFGDMDPINIPQMLPYIYHT